MVIYVLILVFSNMNDTYCLIICSKLWFHKYILRKNGPFGEIIMVTNNKIKIKMMINTIGLKIIRVSKTIYNNYVYLKLS